MAFYFYANGYILQYKFLYWNEMLFFFFFFYGKCKLKSEEQKCNKWTEKKKKFKCVIIQHRLKKETRDYLWDFYLVFSYAFYLSIYHSDKCWWKSRSCETDDLTHINQWESQHLHDREGSFKDDLKTHILNPPVQRDANKPYRSYLITTRKCAPSLTAWDMREK